MTRPAVAARPAPGRGRRRAFILILAFAPAALLYLVLETAALVLYHHPDLFPFRSGTVYLAFRHLYLAQLQLVQFDPACSAYNEAIGNFTLRPGGSCLQSSTEFAVELKANAMGLRDTDAALVGPEVIVLGASFVMGWGVNEDQTVARMVQQATGLRTLNAGLPGYNLWQDLTLLDHLDRSQLRYVVIGVSPVNVGAAAQQILAQDRPVTDYELPRQAYDQAVASYAAGRRPLVLGTYLFRLLQLSRDIVPSRLDFELAVDGKPAAGAAFDQAGRDIVEVLNRAAPLLGDSKAKIIMFFVANQCRRMSDQLVAAINKQAVSAIKRLPKEVVALPVDADLRRSDCFVFDGHINASGQALHARKVIEAILADRPAG